MPLFSLGPSGGLGGDGINFSTPSADPTYDLNNIMIQKIEVRHGIFIDRIRFTYASINDQIPRWIRSMGGDGGRRFDVVNLKRTEVVTRIFGRYGIYVDTISIEKTDIDSGEINTFGPFGNETGGSSPFVYRVPPLATQLPPPHPPPQKGPWADMAIMGLWGGAGIFVDALGVIIRR